MGVLPPIRAKLKDGTAIVLRSAEERDAPAAIEFRRRTALTSPFIATTAPEVPSSLDDQLKSIGDFRERPTELLLVAESGSSIIAMCGLRSPGRVKLNHCVDLGMSVDEPWRARGVGRAIMTAALDWAAANPAIEKVTLGVIPENTAAVRLYESLGFVSEGVQRGQFKQPGGERLDHIFMAMWVKPGVAPPGQHVHPC